MKKVLYFIPEFPRLTETFIEREVSKLIELGNLDIGVFSLKKASGKMSDNVAIVTNYKRLDVKTLIESFRYKFTKTSKVVEAWKLIYRDSSRSIFSSAYFFIKALGYTRLFEKYGPDHIHAHFLSDPSSIALVASTVLGIPFSVSGHARDVFVEGTLIPEKAERAKFIAICNKAAYEKCLELAGEKHAGKISLIYHGVDPNAIFSTELKKQKPTRPLIFSAARLVEKKGLAYLIDASKILRERGVDHEIRIAGPGPLYWMLSEKISSMKLQDSVIIEGNGKGVPFDEISQFYRIADIFVLPSIDTDAGDADGVPTVVIEAALAKLPIVTTDAGSITDLVADKETGLIVPQKDPQALALAIEKLISDVPARQRIGEEARRRAEEMFDINNNISDLERLLLK
jgi:colanic acid/amylovoran biosynthesis glycosyltransferase